MENEIDWTSLLIEANQEESIDYEQSILNRLSPELLLQILSYLSWNDALITAPVCSTFRDLVNCLSFWARQTQLDFRYCKIPLAENISKVVSSSPAIEKLTLGDVIIENPDNWMEVCPANSDQMEIDFAVNPEQENNDGESDEDDERKEIAQGTPYDKFIADIVQRCPNLKDIMLESQLVSQRTVESVSVGLPNLETLALSESELLNSSHIENLLATARNLKSLCISRCRLIYPQIRKEDGKLQLTSLSIIRCSIRKTDIMVLAQNCPQLKYLDLSESSVFDMFGPPEVTGASFPCLENLQLKYCRDLEQVIVEDAPELRCVDTSAAGFLAYIKLKCSKLQQVIVDNCTSLTEMVVHSDHMETLDLSPHMHVLAAVNVNCPKLNELKLYNCPMLRRDQVAGIKDLEKVKKLLFRCLSITFDDLENEILPKLKSVEEMSFQGFTSSSLNIESSTLQMLELQELMYLADISLITPKLEVLKLRQLRVLAEQDLVKCLNMSLRELHLSEIPGLHGQNLSLSGDELPNLSTLVIRNCGYLKKLTLKDWRSLSSVSVGGCSHLKDVCVQSENIKSLEFWWLHLNSFTVKAPNLESLDLKGSDFRLFDLSSELLATLDIAGLCTDYNSLDSPVKTRCPALKQLCVQRSPFLTSQMLHNLLISAYTITDLQLINCQDIRELTIPVHIKSLKLAGLYHLTQIHVHPDCKLQDVSLSALPKISMEMRDRLLNQMAPYMNHLHLRLLNEESSHTLSFSNLVSLYIDQGLHLENLVIKCPKLQVLGIKGCPNLLAVHLEVDCISKLSISQSMPLNALQSLHVVTSSVKYLAKTLHEYCPRLKDLELSVDTMSLVQLTRFGIQNRNLIRIVLHPGTNWDEYLTAMCPRPFHVPFHVLNRPAGKDLQVTFS